MQLITPLIKLALKTSQRRLCRDWLFTTCVVCAMSIIGLLTALSASWLLQQLSYQNPYQHDLPLWSVRLYHQQNLAGYDDSQAAAPALYQLMATPEMAEQLSLADPQTMTIQSENMHQAERHKVLIVMGNFWLFTPESISYGRIPLPEKNEIAISFSKAIRLYGSAENALQKTLLLNKQSYRVSAVLKESFAAPGELSRQSLPEQKIAAVLPYAEHMTIPDAYQRTLYLLASHSNQRILQQEILQLMERLNIAQDTLLPLSLEIKPLHEVMDGGRTKKALAGFSFVMLLAAVTIFSIALLSRVRFSQRSQNKFVAEIAGANRWQQRLFEYSEVIILATLSLIIAWFMLQLSYSLLKFSPILSHLLSPQFKQANLILLCGFMIIAFLCLWFASQITATRNNGRGIAAKASGKFGLAILQGTQVLLALVALTICLQQSKQAWQALSSATTLDVKDVYQLDVQYPAGTPSQLMAADLANLKQRLLIHPEMQKVAITNAAALDLIGAIQSYRGPAMFKSELLSSQGSTQIYRSERNTQQRYAELDYSLSVVTTEPEFFTIMGYQLLSGHPFAAEERDKVLLTPTAASILFPQQNNILGLTIPSSGRESPQSVWHNHIHVSGVIHSVVMTDPQLTNLTWFNNFPVVFVPYHAGLDLTTLSSLSQNPEMRLIFQTTKPPIASYWQHNETKPLVAQTKFQLISLEKQLKQRLAFHLLSASAIFSLAIAVLLTLVMVSYSNIRLAFQARQSEFALRLTLGANEKKLSWWLIRKEMQQVITISFIWVCLGILLPKISLLKTLPFSTSEFVSASTIVVAVCLLSGLIALREALAISPMSALSNG